MSGPARLATLAAALLAAAPGPAGAYDPAYRWRTLATPHFLVHHHQGEEALAARVAEVAERAHARLVPLLGYAPPGPTHLVLSDDVDDANGSATPLPRNLIRLYAVPPESDSVLQDSRDWLTQLVEHEYVHVLHLDHVGGAPAVVNAIFGKLWVPNGFSPGWLTEGIAVAHEADDQETGRNRSAQFDMWARAQAVEPPGLMRLPVLTNQPLEWPRGHAPYLLGGRFVEFLLARSGPAALRGFIAEQGSQLWPWSPGYAAERWFGADFPALWGEFGAALQRRYAAELDAIRARPVTAPRRLTARGGEVTRPRWAPGGGSLVYLDRGPEERAGLRRVDLAGRDLGRLLPVDVHGLFALRGEGQAVLAKGQVWREFRVYDDLYLVELDGGRERRLTDGERATDPALTPDGGAIVYVARIGGGELELRRRALPGDGAAAGPAEPLLHRPGAQLYDPAVSPDGRRIALSIQEAGRRDLWLLEDGRLTRLTDDDAIDLQPAWTPDGRWLLFASDRGGVFNLHAWSAETGALRQVTNVETGALGPAVSPDGRTIAFSTYGRQGYDLAVIPFDEASWLEEATPPPRVDPLIPSAGPLTPSVGPLTPSVAPEARSRGAEARSRGAGAPTAAPYAPTTALPTFWLPTWSADGSGATYGLFTAGADVVGLHAWQAQGWWSVESETLGYAASYVGGWSWPALDLLSERIVETSPGEPLRLTSAWTPLAGGATFTVTRVERALALRLGWSVSRWTSLGGPVDASAAPPEHRFEDGTLSEATFAASYADARRYAWSISSEEGRRLTLRARLAGQGTGSDYDLWRTRASWSEYLRVPSTRHVVLATRLSGGLAHGSLGGSPPYTLGGVTSPDPVDLFLLQAFPVSDQLRGYPAGALAGNGVALANLELRFPIAAPSAGRSTWPLFLRRVHGALFLDAGETFVHGTERGYAGPDFRWDALRFGAGAELRLETVLAYWLMTDLRIGVARGLGRLLRGEGPADDPLATWQGYVTFGPSF